MGARDANGMDFFWENFPSTSCSEQSAASVKNNTPFLAGARCCSSLFIEVVLFIILLMVSMS